VIPTETTVPGAPVTVPIVVLRPLQLYVAVRPSVEGVGGGATRLPPGEKATRIVVAGEPKAENPVFGSLCSVTLRLPSAACPVFEVAASVPEATTEAALVAYLELLQLNGVPGTGAVTVKVVVN
jgi:hypothetical protein